MQHNAGEWAILCAVIGLSALGIALCADSGISPAELNSIGIVLRQIPAGTFEMGLDAAPLPAELLKAEPRLMSKRRADGDYDETPRHTVTISKEFFIGETEVTVEQYRQFRPDYKGDKEYSPYATGVNWYDAGAFCEWLSKKEGKPYRLPTEAEWEYAARAGTKT